MGRNGIWFLGLLLAFCSAAFGADDVLVLYNGQATLPATLVRGDWGYMPHQDPVKEMQPVRLPGGSRSYGLLVQTLGRYQGPRFDLATPVDTAAFFGVKNTYLELYLRPVQQDDKPAADPTAATQPVVVTPPTDPAAPGATQAPWESEEPKAAPATITLPALKNLRFTFFTDKGQGILDVTPEEMFPKEEVDRRWVKVDIPLTKLNKLLPVGGNLTRIVITSDEPAQFLLGRLAIVKDDAPIKVKMKCFPPFMESKRSLFFWVTVDAGLTQYESTWDFDTKAGQSIDAQGDRITYTYDAEGTYLITCTVVDKNGGKAPVTASLEVKVLAPLAEEN